MPDAARMVRLDVLISDGYFYFQKFGVEGNHFQTVNFIIPMMMAQEEENPGAHTYLSMLFALTIWFTR